MTWLDFPVFKHLMMGIQLPMIDPWDEQNKEKRLGRGISLNFMYVMYQNKLETDEKDIKYENKMVIEKKTGKCLTHVKLGKLFISIKATEKNH